MLNNFKSIFHPENHLLITDATCQDAWVAWLLVLLFWVGHDAFCTAPNSLCCVFLTSRGDLTGTCRDWISEELSGWESPVAFWQGEGCLCVTGSPWALRAAVGWRCSWNVSQGWLRVLWSVQFEASCQNEKTVPGYAAADWELDFLQEGCAGTASFYVHSHEISWSAIQIALFLFHYGNNILHVCCRWISVVLVTLLYTLEKSKLWSYSLIRALE